MRLCDISFALIVVGRRSMQTRLLEELEQHRYGPHARPRPDATLTRRFSARARELRQASRLEPRQSTPARPQSGGRAGKVKIGP